MKNVVFQKQKYTILLKEFYPGNNTDLDLIQLEYLLKLTCNLSRCSLINYGTENKDNTNKKRFKKTTILV